MLVPTATFPSPNVSARSANDGPKVVAVLACSPVLGSSLNTNPPEDVPSGPDETSSEVAREMADAAAGEPVGVINCSSVWRKVKFGLTLVNPVGACAKTGALRTSQRTANANTDRFIAISTAHRR
jgi:hypothetical protein